ncbi:MAG: hypothetical protein DRP45_00190 [Candidatus Zixiibacteriota bacterium]|nr:MAG: hypothetical protein DRP45_00190 [candidate division Zixibacteria bacterium]
MAILKDIKELIRGLGITGKHLGRHAITIQYPEEKWTMPERSRGIVVLLSDKETGELNCTGCELCQRACPSAAIKIDAPRGEDKKKVLKEFVIDFGLCCFCGLCEESCNFCAIKMVPKYEFSDENKENLVWDIKKLQEMGLDVDYVDTRRKKKKPVDKAKPADKTSEKPAEATPSKEPNSSAGNNDQKKPEGDESSPDQKETRGEES